MPKGCKILLVEENYINQEIAKELLHGLGSSVSIANNGVEALEKFTANPYDLILMDINMPVMDGWETTKRIRNHEVGKDIPIIAITASTREEDYRRSTNAGMNDCINKPFDPELFHATVIKWLKERDACKHRQTPAVVQIRAEDLEGLALVNCHSGENYLGNNPVKYRELLKKFIVLHGEDGELIHQALMEHHPAKAHQKLHALRGVAIALGLERLNKAAVTLEDLLHQHADNPQLLPVAQLLKAVMHDTCEQIARKDDIQ